MSTAIEIRLEMAAKGWHSEDRITNMGWGDKGMGYSIWFERWDWHGKRLIETAGRKASYHAHTPDLGAIGETTARAAKLAQKAWDEFPNCAPSQLVGDELQAEILPKPTQ